MLGYPQADFQFRLTLGSSGVYC